MELMDAIYNRRSVRNYDSKTVDKKTVEILLNAAVQAPSATNSQPWAYAVIQDSSFLAEFSTRAKQYLLTILNDYPGLARYRAALSNPDFNIFYNAGTLIIIYAKPTGLHPQEDCCLAAQNLMLAAHGMGLGTCWIGFARPLLNTPEVKRELGVPQDYEAAAPIIAGYPKEPTPKIVKNNPEILFWR